MGTKTKINQAKQMASDQALIDGFTKHAATLVTLLVAGNTVQTASLITVLQARIQAIKNAIAAHKAFTDAVAAARAEIVGTAAQVSGARQALKVAFSGQASTLGDFGLELPKARTPLTAEQKAAAKAKAEATREARHTMGPKQKAKVTGETAAAPAAPAPAPVTPKS